jgi:hypothetical protein
MHTGGCVHIQGWCNFFFNIFLDIPTSEDGPLYCLEMMKTNYPLMQSRITQEPTPQLHYCKNKKNLQLLLYLEQPIMSPYLPHEANPQPHIYDPFCY